MQMRVGLSSMRPSEALERWRARGRFVRVGSLDVFVVDAPGPEGATPLLLLHGFPSSSFDYHLVLDDWAERRRVVTLDLPGFGFSSKPRDYSYSLIEQADVVEMILRELGIARVQLVAHDMGTSVATELMARRARGLLHVELDALVLLNGSIHVELARLTPSQKLLRVPRLGDLFARLAHPALFRAQLKRTLARPIDAAEIDDMWLSIREGDGHRVLPRTIGYVDDRWRFRRRWISALETFDRPALVLWGARDPVAVLAIGEQVARETPGCRLVVLDDVGHYPQLEDAPRVRHEVELFLASL
jgi:pimeloyl-ACP methyl ester carboxylesterase